MNKKKNTNNRASRRANQNEIIDSNNGWLDQISLIDIKRLTNKIRPKNKTQELLTEYIHTKDVINIKGSSGVGKTFLSIGNALKLLHDEPTKFKKIILLKSVNQMLGQEIGFIPGDATEKLQHNNMSYFDNFYQLIGKEKTHQLIDNGIINFEVVSFIRGRDLRNSIIIVDEAQNFLKSNIHTIITRMSQDSKVIIMGDPNQCDLKYPDDSFFDKYFTRCDSFKNDMVGNIAFDEDEVVRHPLIPHFNKNIFF